jgi:hypothetical protein
MTTLQFIVVAAVFGIIALYFSQENFQTFQTKLSTSFASDISRIQESMMVENAVYHTSTQSFNVTLDNIGYEGINIKNVTLTDLKTNKVQLLNYAAVGTGSSCSSSPSVIALDNPGQTEDDTSRSSTTTLSSFTVGSGTNRLLLVTVHMEHQTVTVASVTYGGVNLSQVTTSTGSTSRTELWEMVNPNSGSADIVVNLNNARNLSEVMVGAISFTGVDQINPIPTTAPVVGGDGGNTYNTISDPITTAYANSWVVDAITWNAEDNSVAPNSGQTQTYNVVGSRFVGASSYVITTSSGLQNLGWTASNSHTFSALAVEVKTSGGTVCNSGGGSSGTSSSNVSTQGIICGMLPHQSCTVSLFYHCFSHPVSISVTTSRGTVLTTQSAPVVPWYNSQWQFRKEITINNAEVNGMLSNFPVLVNINDQGLASNAQSSGSDIVFTACDGKTPLNYEIEKYSSSTGSLQAWVEIPTLYSSPNDIIYIYYGNPNNILPHVTLTLTNSQNSATPVPFQQEITFNPSQYMSSEAANLGNIRFCADTSCNTQFYSWLETCTPSCTNAATQATAWVQLTSAVPANGAQTIYMVFQPTSTNFDGNYWGESYQISTSYDNIAKVMNAGLLTQIYYYSVSTCSSTNYQNQLYSALLGNGVTISGCASFVSSTNPSTTPATGSSQNVNGIAARNVIINYQTGNSGGGSWPNPPVSDTTKSWNAKAVGWANVKSHILMGLELDDGGAMGTSTTQGGFTTGGTNWLGGASNPNNIISGWIDQSARNYTSNTIPTIGDNRIETDYSENGGQTYFGMWSNMTLNYYSFTYPPNGVMPTVTTNIPWDSNYVGVWHFKEDPSGTAPQMKDSTSNGNHLTSSGMTSANQVPGKIDGSLNFVSASSQYLSDTSATNMPANNGVQTESAWFLVSSNPNSAQDILTLKTSGSSAVKMGFTSSNFAISTGGGSTLVTASLAILPAGTWHYAVYTYDGTTNILYIDGAKVTSSTSSPNSGTPSSVYVGTFSGSGEFFNGGIDETRVSNIVRSSSWIYTEYNNQANLNSFLTVGTQQSVTDPRTMY